MLDDDDDMSSIFGLGNLGRQTSEASRQTVSEQAHVPEEISCEKVKKARLKKIKTEDVQYETKEKEMRQTLEVK